MEETPASTGDANQHLIPYSHSSATDSHSYVVESGKQIIRFPNLQNALSATVFFSTLAPTTRASNAVLKSG
jgi:hypothetical protein